MKTFVNKHLNAHNVIELDVSQDIVNELVELFEMPLNENDFFVDSPGWSSDVKWISQNSIKIYKVFLSTFKKLSIEEKLKTYIDYENEIIMYSGFFVTRSKCTSPNFHMDWTAETENNAFTLITPIIHPENGPNLIYVNCDGTVSTYRYRKGKALTFGTNFVHSTEPRLSNERSVLLCFTFGTDKIEHWPAISKTAETQGNLLRLPDGNFRVRDV